VAFTVLALGMVERGSVGAETSNATGLRLEPTAVRINLEAGDRVERSLEIRNFDDQPVGVEMSVRPYWVMDADYQPIFSQNNYYTEIVNWVSFDRENFEIPAKGKANAKYIVTVPDDPPRGGQYAAVFASVRREDEGALGRIDRLTHLVYTRVNGDTREEFEIKDMDLPWLVSDRKPEEKVLRGTARVVNTGNVDVEARQVLILRSLFFGSKLYERVDDKVVLPETERNLALGYDEGQPVFGVFRAEYEVSVGTEMEQAFVILVIAPQWLMVLSAVVLIVGAGVLIVVLFKKIRDPRSYRP